MNTTDKNTPSRQTRLRSDLHNPRNYLLHGFFYLFYAIPKYISFPFANYIRFFILRLFGANIRSSYISDGVSFVFPWRINVGTGCSLNQGVMINGYGGVKIGNGVRIASYVCINTADHDFSDPEVFIKDQGMVVGTVTIDDDVWIGNHVVINRGVDIGKGCVIGSGAVVTKDIPPYSVAVGVPCRVIRSRK